MGSPLPSSGATKVQETQSLNVMLKNLQKLDTEFSLKLKYLSLGETMVGIPRDVK